MKLRYVIALSLLSGVVMGAGAMKTMQAQAKPPGFAVIEIDVTDVEAYNKEYVPLATKALGDAGAKFLVRGGKRAAIIGEAPPSRVVIAQFETFEKAQAAYTSPTYKEASAVGQKYGKFRIWAAEGVAP
jgi:uncharacterized protein (DUF1330 family)